MESSMKDVRAVSLLCRGKSCAAAQALNGQRRFASESAVLPLAACTMPDQCKCRYQKYTDRREDDDRRILGSTTRGAMFGISERRRSGGRRPLDR
jgi:hypothetical protein